MEQSNNANKRIAIIGGGISGLSAAWYLQQNFRDADITVLEEAERWGGKVVTEHIDGYGERSFIIEGGPESFVTRKPEVYKLAQELGMGKQIVPSSEETRDIYVLDDGRVLPVPLGPIAFIRSPLMSIGGKLRMLAEPFIRAKRDDEDESLADFTQRRLGKQALEKFIGPILGGIYNTNPEKQSILTTSPIMREIERDHGGLFVGTFARMRKAKKEKAAEDTPRPPRFIAFEKGAEALIDELCQQLNADLRLGTTVQQIKHQDDGYELKLSDGNRLVVDAVILATPANVSAQLVQSVAPESAEKLATIEHVHIGTISLVFRESEVQPKVDIQGLMIPRREKRAIDAVTWTSRKTHRSAPDGYALFRVFFGGASPEVAEMDDEELLSVVRSELKDLLAIDAEPIEYRVFRWLNSYPQAAVGHLNLVREIEQSLPAGLFVTGSSYRGLAVPDCIRQAKNTAEQAAQYFQSKPVPTQATVS
jgi:oxygen-dependent protoporphyrinogen oxidase